jgi:pimeloyl-ACP methyl ester carboxylesterase
VSGPRVLLLHGFLSGRCAWDGVTAELAAAGIGVIAPDLPGYGTARGVAATTAGDMAAYLRPLIEREQPTHIAGHSMGAIIALELAAADPARFERVGLVGLPVYTSREDGVAFIRQRVGHRLFLKRDAAAHVGCGVLSRTHRIWWPAVRYMMPRQPRAHIFAAFDHAVAGHGSALNNIVFAGRVPGLAARVTTPVVALHGGRDRSARLDRVRELAALHGWELCTAPTASHQAPVVRPRLVARWVREHLLAPAPLAVRRGTAG